MRFGFSYKECKESIAQWYEEAKELIACQPDQNILCIYFYKYKTISVYSVTDNTSLYERFNFGSIPNIRTI